MFVVLPAPAEKLDELLVQQRLALLEHLDDAQQAVPVDVAVVGPADHDAGQFPLAKRHQDPRAGLDFRDPLGRKVIEKCR